MSIIYVPKGKAREYSPLAVNLYIGCNHQCKYCFSPGIMFKKREDYKIPIPRRNILSELEKDCKKHTYSNHQVLFCFMTDPYNSKEMELNITRDALKLMFKYRIPVSILTKAGLKIFKDIDIIKKFENHIQIGATLTMNNSVDSKEWEPEAALPNKRLDMLEKAKENNIRTWASFEPVIDIKQSLDMIEASLPFVDLYKIGKLNNYKGLDKTMDWPYFLSAAVDILRIHKKPFYIKHDLRIAAEGVKLYGNEVAMDEHNLESWDNQEQLNFF